MPFDYAVEADRYDATRGGEVSGPASRLRAGARVESYPQPGSFGRCR